jgi:hypothetical protein
MRGDVVAREVGEEERDRGKVVEQRRREINGEKRRKCMEIYEECTRRIDQDLSESKDGTNVNDAEVNRIDSPATLPIASHVDLPVSSHQCGRRIDLHTACISTS